jgi:hypothetical protein
MCLKGKTDQPGGMGSCSSLFENATTDFPGIYRCGNSHHSSGSDETGGFGYAPNRT